MPYTSIHNDTGANTKPLKPNRCFPYIYIICRTSHKAVFTADKNRSNQWGYFAGVVPSSKPAVVLSSYCSAFSVHPCLSVLAPICTVLFLVNPSSYLSSFTVLCRCLLVLPLLVYTSHICRANLIIRAAQNVYDQ